MSLDGQMLGTQQLRISSSKSAIQSNGLLKFQNPGMGGPGGGMPPNTMPNMPPRHGYNMGGGMPPGGAAYGMPPGAMGMPPMGGMPPGPPPMGMGGGAAAAPGMMAGMMGGGPLPGPPPMAAGGATPAAAAAAATVGADGEKASTGEGEGAAEGGVSAGCTVRVDNVDAALGDADLRSLFQSQVRVGSTALRERADVRNKRHTPAGVAGLFPGASPTVALS
jgi:hypothetical protein